MQTATNTPTTADLVAQFVAKGGTVTTVPAAKADGAAAKMSQTKAAKPVKRATKKAIERLAKQVNKTSTAAEKPAKSTKAAVKETKAKIAIRSGDVSVADIAAEFKMTGKAVRTVLRRHMTKPADGWTFDAATAKKVRALLTK